MGYRVQGSGFRSAGSGYMKGTSGDECVRNLTSKKRDFGCPDLYVNAFYINVLTLNLGVFNSYAEAS